MSKQFFSSEYPAECPADDEAPEPAASLQENPSKDSSMQPAGMTRMWRWISAASAWRWSHLPQAMWGVGGQGGGMVSYLEECTFGIDMKGWCMCLLLACDIGGSKKELLPPLCGVAICVL